MTLGEKLKNYRLQKGLTQEKTAELIGISRQAVAKWECDETIPSSENLMALASIYGISLDDLTNEKVKSTKKENKILRTNLSLIAIVWQSAALGVAVQPNYIPNYETLVLVFKVLFILIPSIWMAFNLRYEKNQKQYRLNTKIELLYCIVQCAIALACYYLNIPVYAPIFLVIPCIIYILVINPKYMNRKFTK